MTEHNSKLNQFAQAHKLIYNLEIEFKLINISIFNNKLSNASI